MKIIDQILEKGEYFQEVFEKNTIYLHHTAGSSRPDWVIHGWDTDDEVNATTKKKNARVVATAYVVGGISTKNDKSFDGLIYRAFDEKFWAHHIGSTQANNRTLNRQSIGIEICNYGPLKLANDGNYYNYVNKPMPKDQVVKLKKPFRGYLYYHAYTSAQIQACKELILDLKNRFPKINLSTPLLNPDGFEINADVCKGINYGIVSHSNIRKDKFDIFPQPEMINMLKEICS